MICVNLVVFDQDTGVQYLCSKNHLTKRSLLMKKLISIVLMGVFVTGIAQANTSGNHTKLAANCPQGCSSCWEQCQKSDDCGSGHKCVRDACGTHCTKN